MPCEVFCYTFIGAQVIKRQNPESMPMFKTIGSACIVPPLKVWFSHISNGP